jgi:hypothetical protein
MKGSRSSIRQKPQGSLNAFVLDNDVLRLTIVPELGGKIVSLIRLESGYEYLLQPPDLRRAYQTRSYGSNFEDYETSGFDECAPTVARCLYPEAPFLASQLPDHGDVWCLPSVAEIVGEDVRLTTPMRSLPLRFSKKIQIQESKVRLDYEGTNLSPATVKFLWSAHPLLQVEPGAEIILPKEVNEVEVGWSKGDRMGKSADRCTWPEGTESSGQKINLSRMASPHMGTAEKLFTPRLSEGFCGMFLPRVNEGIAFRFDPRLVSYIGIWICQGGWPASRARKDFTVALEPCLGRPNSLAQAIRRNECAILGGYGSMRWWMEIEVHGGAPRTLRM